MDVNVQVLPVYSYSAFVCIQEHSKDDDNLDSLLDNVVGLKQMLESSGDPLPLGDQDIEPVLSAPESLQNLFNNR